MSLKFKYNIAAAGFLALGLLLTSGNASTATVDGPKIHWKYAA